MKHFSKIIWVIFFFLIVGNIYVFVGGLKLSDEMNKYESEIKKIHQENIDLEKKVFEVESLKYTASMAAVLNFTGKTAPIVLNRMPYALNR